MKGGHDVLSENVSLPQVEIAAWKFDEFSVQISVLLFLFAMILIKIVFHRLPYVSEYVPESLVLIALGIIFAIVVRFGIQRNAFQETAWQLTPHLFFHYLLPPIVLDSAYSLYNRTFSEYLGVILVFAVLGTIVNFFLIGLLLFGLNKIGALGWPELNMDLKSFLLFSSLIVAVDPVAVLAIFQDIGIHLGLYYIVFGESLLNDAVTVVIYNIMAALVGKKSITVSEILVGVASFFTVSLGGLLVGILIGVITCLITRVKSPLNALTTLILAYFSYIMADTVGWSGIIAMIGCGLVQAAYAFHNLDREYVILVRKLTKLVAEMSDSVIFLFLGIEILMKKLEWHTGFILWSLLICLLSRAVVVVLFTACVNYVNVDNSRISLTEQIILIYGGLRGAVAFSLAVLINPQIWDSGGEYNRGLILTATLFIILFTVGFMGMTMKPLVKLLKIRVQAKQQLSLFMTLQENLIDEILAGIETLSGSKGRNVVRDFCMRIDEKYIRPLLQRNPQTYDERIMTVYKKIALKLHMATIHPHRLSVELADLPATLKNKYIASMISSTGLTSTICDTIEELDEYGEDRDDEPRSTADSSSLAFSNDIEKAHRESTVKDLSDCIRSAKRISLASHTSNRQMDFDETLEEMLRLRSRAFRRHITMSEAHRNSQVRQSVFATARLPGSNSPTIAIEDDDDDDQSDGDKTNGTVQIHNNNSR